MNAPNPLAPADVGRRSVQPDRYASARALFDRVAAPAVAHLPGATARLIDGAMRIASGSGIVGPRRGDIRALFGSSARRDAADIAWRCAALRVKNHAAIAVARRYGIDGLAALVDVRFPRPPDLLLGEAAILLSCHVGVHNGASAAIRRWGLDVLALPTEGIESPQGRAIAMRKAVDVLRGGGLVLAAMDGPFGTHTAPVRCFGRDIVLRRGPFALARLTGARALPFVARWTVDGRVEPIVAGALAAAGDGVAGEAVLAASAASWLEQYLTAHPEEAWPYTVSNLLRLPLANGSPA